MSQATLVIANNPFPTVRAAINAALLALVSGNSGPVAPNPTYAHMLWADTGNDILKQRNADNDGWIDLLVLSTGKILTPIDSDLLDSTCIDIGMCQFRLTLTSGAPVTTADVTAAATIYLTPFKGNRIALYDGANWKMRSSAEMSIAVPNAASTIYDVFVYDDAGVPTMELCAWTNDTTRATDLALQNGVYCKSGALTRRYVGTFRTTSVAGQTEDSKTKRYVWNYYNRVPRSLQKNETGGTTWTYTTAAFRIANNNAANLVDTVIGVVEDAIKIRAIGNADNTNANVFFSVGIGVNSTLASGPLSSGFGSGSKVAGMTEPFMGEINYPPSLGRSYYAWLEYSAATGTTTWRSGANSGQYSGITGEVMA